MRGRRPLRRQPLVASLLPTSVAAARTGSRGHPFPLSRHVPFAFRIRYLCNFKFVLQGREGVDLLDAAADAPSVSRVEQSRLANSALGRRVRGRVS